MPHSQRQAPLHATHSPPCPATGVSLVADPAPFLSKPDEGPSHMLTSVIPVRRHMLIGVVGPPFTAGKGSCVAKLATFLSHGLFEISCDLRFSLSRRSHCFVAVGPFPSVLEARG